MNEKCTAKSVTIEFKLYSAFVNVTLNFAHVAAVVKQRPAVLPGRVRNAATGPHAGVVTECGQPVSETFFRFFLVIGLGVCVIPDDDM